MTKLRSWILASAVLAPGSAFAADIVVPPAAAPTVSAWPGYEVRGGVFAHDPWSPEKGSIDVNLEALTPRLFAVENPTLALFVPRFHVGATINTAGKTSSGYAGLTWTIDVGSRIFVEASFGGAIHNGKTGSVVYPDHSALGCSPLFRESASIGYRVTEAISVMATVEHLSNAGLCTQNRGLTNAGMRLGYSF